VALAVCGVPGTLLICDFRFAICDLGKAARDEWMNGLLDERVPARRAEAIVGEGVAPGFVGNLSLIADQKALDKGRTGILPVSGFEDRKSRESGKMLVLPLSADAQV
jgi:hypothetical protein